MFQIVVPGKELYDSVNNLFIPVKGQTLTLEHSLISIVKWESKYHRPYFSEEKKDAKTTEETIDYIRFMTLTKNVDPMIYYGLSEQNYKDIENYIKDPMTATWFSTNGQKRAGQRSSEVVTSELVYYWMTINNIPFECEKWPFNRLMTLIHICNVKNSASQKMSQREVMQQNSDLNAARRAAMHSKG